MKKISVTAWIFLGGIFLYTASLWQRPLFVFEFACGYPVLEALYSGNVVPAREALSFFIFKYLGTTPFSWRIIPALLTLAAAGMLFFAGRNSISPVAGKGGALIFLLTPAVFLCGTTATVFMYNGAFVLTGFFALFSFSESKTWKKAIFPGVIAAASLFLSLFRAGDPTCLFFTAAAWLLYTGTELFSCNTGSKSSKLLTQLLPLLLFLPALFLLPHAEMKPVFQLPCVQDLKTFAAFTAAGSFPWILFWIAILKNLPVRFKFIWSDRFTRAAFILTAASFFASLFSTADAAFFIPFLGGSAILLAAGLEMEHAEEGFRSTNTVLYIVAIIFFSAALFIGSWGALGVFTKMLKPAWKIFSARDSWILTAIVPIVSAVWCLTAAGEKISKERKFLSFSAGCAFLLLAFHGLVPLKVTEHNAPVNFLYKVVMPRTGKKVLFFGDKSMIAPLQCVFRESSVKSISLQADAAEIKNLLKKRKKICIVTQSRHLSDKLPFPKTTLRSGRFTAVFYNIDFPEMRVREP